MKLKFKKTRDVNTPTRGTEFSAGLDFYLPNDAPPLTIMPGRDALVPSGIIINLECRPVALIAFNKSGVATKKHLDVRACVVDSDYQGEIFINLHNSDTSPQSFNPGDKLVQFIMVPVLFPELEETHEELFDEKTQRGTGSCGSTGER